MTLTGLKKHLQVLEHAGLVVTEKRGRTRHCRLGSERLEDAAGWIDAYRRHMEEQFARLDELLERRKESP